MAYKLDMGGEARQLIRHLHPQNKQKIKRSLRDIACDPLQGKALQEDLAGLFSYRVGSTRIIYSIDHDNRIIHIVAIGPRQTVYSALERELLRRSGKKKSRL